MLIFAKILTKAVIRQFSAQKPYAKKKKMQKQKIKIIIKMTNHLFNIYQSYKEKIKAQKRYFQIKLEKVSRKLE